MTLEFAFCEHDGPVRLEPFVVRRWPCSSAADVRAAGEGARADPRVLRRHRSCEGLDELATGVDLLLAEAAFRSRENNPPGMHLTGADWWPARAAALVDSW